MNAIPPDKLPPHNLEAEIRVLGAMLMDNQAIDEVIDACSPEDFYRDTHATLCRAIFEMRRDATRVEPIALLDYLQKRGWLEKSGGEEVITEAMVATIHAGDAPFHAQIVRQRAIAREVIEAAHATLRDAYSDRYTSDELVSSLERRAFAISDRREQSRVVRVDEAVAEAMAEFQILSDQGAGGGLMTGFGQLDAMLGGMLSRLYLVGASPGNGKTAFGLNVADHVASKEGQAVLFCSLEMGTRELVHRYLANRASVDSKRIRMPMLANDDDRARLNQCIPLIRGVPLFIDDNSTMTVSQIAATARRIKAKEGLGMVVVDYVQLVEPDNRKDMRQEQVASISRGLRSLAKDLDAPILALAQLNRKVQDREDKKPRMSDLRESGQLEADAQGVILLFRPSYYDQEDRPGLGYVILDKNRSGPTGTIEMAFEAPYTRFSTLDHRDDANIRGIGQPF